MRAGAENKSRRGVKEWERTNKALFSTRGPCAVQMEVIPPHLHRGGLVYGLGVGTWYYHSGSQVLESLTVCASVGREI